MLEEAFHLTAVCVVQSNQGASFMGASYLRGLSEAIESSTAGKGPPTLRSPAETLLRSYGLNDAQIHEVRGMSSNIVVDIVEAMRKEASGVEIWLPVDEMLWGPGFMP